MTEWKLKAFDSVRLQQTSSIVILLQYHCLAFPTSPAPRQVFGLRNAYYSQIHPLSSFSSPCTVCPCPCSPIQQTPTLLSESTTTERSRWTYLDGQKDRLVSAKTSSFLHIWSIPLFAVDHRQTHWSKQNVYARLCSMYKRKVWEDSCRTLVQLPGHFSIGNWPFPNGHF